MCLSLVWHKVGPRGKCLVAWHQVHRPLHLEGLGILDPQKFSMALRLWWLWLDRVDPGRPWAGLPSKVDPEAEAFFHASITCTIKNGRSIHFWEDPWLNSKPLWDITPDLVATIPSNT
jgi:hypothetical protein